ncbi:MAG: prolyl oligopeptidase family serine peptidase [Eubacteriales bacterium]
MIKKRVSVVEDYYNISYAGSPDYCSAVEKLAYTKVQADKNHNAYVSQIIVKDLKDGSELSVTAGGANENNPRFSPDGRKLLFLSDVSGKPQIYIHNFESGITKCATTMRYGVKNPLWSPKGDKILFLSSCTPGEDPDKLQVPMTASEQQALERQRAMQPVIIEDYGYKSEDAMGFAKPETTHLWVIGEEENKAIRLSDGDRDHVMPIWSPDGEYIVFSSNRLRPKEESIGMDLFSVPASGGEIKRLTESVWIAYYPAPFVPRFTPDGKYIIIGALAPSLEGGMPLTHLYRLPSEGGDPVCLFPENAPCHEATCFLYNSENPAGRYESAQVSANGKYLYFISGWHGAANIYRANIEGEPEIIQYTHGEHSYRCLGEIQDGRMAVLKGDFLQTPQIYLLDVNTGSEEQITDTNPWFKDVSLSRPEELWIDTHDGDSRVQGWVIPPQNKEEGKKYPAVLYIHGGPTPFYGYALNYEHQAIAGAGMAVIFCNFRGSSGYGSRHQSMQKAFDGTAMYDNLQFLDETIRRFDWIDAERLGVTGGSFGGYMTNWIAGHTRRFKAAVTQRSISNQMISYASSDMAGSSKGYACFEDFMVDQIKKSPVAYADKIDIPFLILHSLGDMRVPVEHAHQLFVAVKDTHPDLPVRMVLFPDSNHSLLTEGPIDLRIIHYNEMIDWFKKYL